MVIFLLGSNVWGIRVLCLQKIPGCLSCMERCGQVKRENGCPISYFERRKKTTWPLFWTHVLKNEGKLPCKCDHLDIAPFRDAMYVSNTHGACHGSKTGGFNLQKVRDWRHVRQKTEHMISERNSWKTSKNNHGFRKCFFKTLEN